MSHRSIFAAGSLAFILGLLTTVSCPSVSFSQQAPLDSKARSDVIDLLQGQHKKSFLEFQKDPAAITFSQAKAGIRSDITSAEFNAVVNQTKKFYTDLKVSKTIQVPTPDQSGVLAFDCVPEFMQPGLTSSRGPTPTSYVRPAVPVDPDRPASLAPGAEAPIVPPPATPQPIANPAVQLATAPTAACPAGTVPIPRVPAAEALAPGYRNLLHQTARPMLDVTRYASEKGLSTSFVPPASPVFQHRWAHAVSSVPNHGAASRLNVWKPSVLQQDMSLSQIWVVAGGDGVRPLQTVEAGWQVMSLWQTPFPTIFTFSSTDSYGQKSCYATKCGTYQPPVAETFVLATNIIVIGAPLTDQSVDGGKQVTVDIKWVRKGDTGDWWLQVNGDWIGYYPMASFNGGPMSLQAEYVDFGGETAGQQPTDQMGSGRFAEEGPGHAAFQSRIRYYDLADKVLIPVVSPSTTDSGSYSIAVDCPSAPEAGAGKFIFFGGPGNGHFGTSSPPVNGCTH